jgi:glyoxylase-like metal-dependent hydrolase (beta-lactamase superfamily II)
MRIGALEVLPVIDGSWRHAASEMYASQPDDEAWAPHRYLLDDDGMVELTIGGFLVRHERNERVVLVDLGLGGNELFDMQGGAMLDSLAALGLRPDEVTDVVFTHLHLDHIGWATVDGEAVFPNATYRCDAADWEHFVTHPPETKSRRMQHMLDQQVALLAPLADRVTPWDADGAIAPGVDIVRTPGHTPGSSLVVLNDGAERALLLGDVVHCPVELLDDEWDGMFDVDPVQAKAARNALVRELEGGDVSVAAAHFPGLRFGRILPGQQHRRFEFLG